MDKIKRMNELVKSFEEKFEIIKQDNRKEVDENKINEERERLKKIARIDEMLGSLPHGETVNNFIEKTTAMPKLGQYNPNYTFLQPHEALDLAIKRVLGSGAPINNLSFYDEINNNMNKMGFTSKSPLDIKSAISNMIK